MSDDDAFAYTLHLLEWGFRLGRPDARSTATRIRDHHLTLAASVARADGSRAAGEHHSERAASIGGIMDRYEDRKLWREPDKGGVLASQMAQPSRRDPIAVLVDKNHLDHAHQAAGRDIARCYEAATREGMAKVRNMDVFVPPPKKMGAVADRMPEWLAERHAIVYLPWTRALTSDPAHNLPFVIDIVVDGRSLDTASKDHRMGWPKGLIVLRRGLELWVSFAGKAMATNE